jgi:hypothetical protein
MKVGPTTIEQESEVSSSFIIQNPKRNRNTHLSRASWYPYYAGFSPYFAQSLLASSGLNQTACIGDPWNGSGTTTTSAAMLGHRAYGYDLNPVMVIVAKARLLSQQETHLIWPITTNILQESKDDSATVIVEDDPLCTWLSPQSAASIRQLDRALQHLLVENAVPSRLGVNLNVGKLTSLAAFFYTALFRTVRTILKPFYASNPTWMKQPHNKDARLQCPLETLLNIFHHEIGSMVIAITRDLYTTDACNDEMHIAVASSDALPVQSGMIDLILSSPPYCTRIDYAVATMPELAVLGYALQGTFQELRRQLIGTSMVPTSVPEPSLAWGTTCNTFLEQLVHHKSKASKSYYYKNHVQYFDAIYRSLTELHRILISHGRCILVVQDSYYKDIHNDLPQIFIEMAGANGLQLTHRVDFGLTRTMASIHPMVRRYRKDFGAIESVLCFVNETH